MMYKIILLISAFFFGLESLTAQACCSGGTPLSSSLGIERINEKSLHLQLAYDYNTQQSLVSRSRKLNDERRNRNTHAILLRSSYAFSKKLSFTGLFSWVQQEEVVNSNFGKNFKSASGFGDAVFLLQHQTFSKKDIFFSLAGGIKIPFGATNKLDSDFGILLNPDLQPGTGSFDFLAGFNFTYYHLFKPNLTFNWITTVRLTEAADRFGGQLKYEFGDEIQNLFGFQYSYAFKHFLLNPSMLLRYRITGYDQSDDQKVPNTSGHWVHLVPGLDVVLTPNWSVGLSGEIPVYRYLDGTQLTTSYRLKISLDYQLSFKK